MGTSTPALINPTVLTWARQESGYPPEPVAKRLNVKTERLLAWERGELRPTVRQAQGLAKFYRRPFGVFFLPEPPVLPPLATEYRRLPGIKPGVESPEFRFALRVMSQRREVALELSEELGIDIKDFNLVAHLSESVTTVGARLREALGITADEQLGWTSDWQAWRRWREAVETAGVLVFQFPKVSLAQVRGVTLFKFPLPAIGINSKESTPGARSFTLLHELTHLALAVGNEERSALGETRDDASWLEVERFAEETASAILIPREMLSSILERVNVSPDAWDISLMRSLAGKFNITPLAMATRLRTAGVLSWDAYNRWKLEWNQYLGTLPKRKGFASPVDKTLGRSGRPFVQLVLESLDMNRITSVEASHYLDLRFEHFDNLRDELRMGPMRPVDKFDDGE
ncbi:MAG: ImmA/IrrE family metallo-endopeptidase [Deltaproteobacteria bacterium]|nr:ImmA/IrrE family metallo-endopeptidase [Deltaproteobacteria bacterium]